MALKSDTVAAYLAALTEDRRASVEAVRQVILANLDAEYAEGIQYGMIAYFVPHAVYALGYHCDPKQPVPFMAIAAQKNHLSLHMMALYIDPDTAQGEETDESRWFRHAWQQTGKKLDMGKACVRFKRADDLALDVIGEAVRRSPAKRYIARYSASLAKRAALKSEEPPKSKPAKKSTQAS